jgi:hypothetical protein
LRRATSTTDAPSEDLEYRAIPLLHHTQLHQHDRLLPAIT